MVRNQVRFNVGSEVDLSDDGIARNIGAAVGSAASGLAGDVHSAYRDVSREDAYCCAHSNAMSTEIDLDHSCGQGGGEGDEGRDAGDTAGMYAGARAINYFEDIQTELRMLVALYSAPHVLGP